MKKLMLTMSAVALLAACATPGEAPKGMGSLELPATTAIDPVSAAWWKQFSDDQLNALVEEALAHNHDLGRAMANIDASRAMLKLARADQLPSVSANMTNTRQRLSQNGTMPLPPGTPLITNDHRLSLDVAYEIDLWGRAAKANSAAKEELLATEYARDTLRTALIAQVVQSYATLQSLDAQYRLYGEAVDAQRESVKLQKLRFDAGDIGELDLRQSEAELIGNETQLPKIDRARGEAERALSILLGRSPKAVIEQAVTRASTPVAAAGVLPDGMPSDLLLRRPDVQSAEARLRAAGARVDAARAAYFPSIALTGSVGRESTQFSDLMSGPSLLWNVVASITQPIWNGGRLEAQKLAIQAQQRQIELDYRDNVANAFREVRNAIGAVAETRSSADSSERRAQALLRAAELTRIRYDGGEASRLDVINAERLALAAQAANADERRALASAQADLFRALGGGWSVRSDTLSAK
jgi:multidrug efflux system outer membrane protein